MFYFERVLKNITIFLLGVALTGCTLESTFNAADYKGDTSTLFKKVYLDTTSMTLSEGSSALINVALTEKNEKDVQVNITMTDTYGRFQTVTSSITIPAQTLSRPLVLQSIDDDIFQDSQTIVLTISSADPEIKADQNTLTITLNDNDSAPVVTVADASTNENNSPAKFAVSLSRASIYTTEFDYATVNGTALAGSDFNAITGGHLTIPAGQLTAEIQVTLLNDALSEPNENFTLTLSNPLKSTLANSVATATIVDEDAVPAITFAQASQSVNENAGTIQVQVNLDAASSQAITLPITVSGTSGLSDYSMVSSLPLVIAAGQTTANISIAITDDTLSEANETLILTMGAPTNAAFGATTVHTITIQDNDALPSVQLSSGSQSVNEDGASASVNLVLSQASGQTVTVPVTLTGTATGASDDYLLVTTVPVVIAAGSTSAPLDFTILNDNAVEGNETAIATLGSPTNATLGATQIHTLTIVDDDVNISINDVSVNEAAGTAVFTVSLAQASLKTVTMNWATADGTALAGTNYTTASGSLTFNPGDTSKTITITILDTAGICEGNRIFYVNLSNAVNGTLLDNQGAGTVQEDDLPTISVGNVSVKEGSIAAVPVNLNQACTLPVTISYTLSDGTAGASDYAGMSATFTLAAGSTSGLLGVTTFEDALVEGSENLTLTISSPVNANLGTANSTITITDNDTTLTATTDVSYITAGPRHTCAIKNGAAYCWGGNGNGDLGIGNQLPSYIPNLVTGLTSGVTKIVAGGLFYLDYRYNDKTCAIVNGAAKCWGYQSYGELGNNIAGYALTPSDVVGLTSGVTDIDTSDSGYAGFSCAVHNGAAKCWGANNKGQLGNGTTTNSNTAVTVSGLSSGVVSIATGDQHACATLTDGTIKCWGYNSHGQLGDGTTTDSLVPVTVAGIDSGATKVTLAYRHSCALVSGGVKCWGYNNYGQLGNGTTTDSLTPVSATGMTSGVVDLATAGDAVWGLNATCAINSSGAVKCWGANNHGQLGDGTYTSKTTATQVSGLTSGFTQISVSTGTACAVQNTGKSYCWGDRTTGQAANNYGGMVYSPSDPVGMTSQISSASVGTNFACAIKNGAAKCWGSNSYGQLGNGNTTAQGSPTQVTGLTSGVTAIATDSDSAYYNRHACAIQDGAVKCWGDNSNGQLGNGTTGGFSSSPVQVSGLTSGAVAVAVSMWHSCAVMNTGTLKCWGSNSHGQLGNNSTTNSNIPVDVTGITNATQVSIAARYSCAIDGGAMKCWGLNANGQLGNNTTTDSLVPIAVSGMSSGVTSIATQGSNASNNFSCAVVSGAAKCWGYGYNGLLGTGNGSDQSVPTPVVGFSSGVKKIISLAGGGCLLTNLGAIHCWGMNYYALISGSLTFDATSTPIANPFATTGVEDIVGGGYGICAITTSNSLKCWGALTSAGLGSVDLNSPTPVEITFP